MRDKGGEHLGIGRHHALADLAERQHGIVSIRQGHQGHGRLRKAIALYKPSSFTRSGLERRFLELCLEAGLPQPRTNFVAHGFELDCYWPEFRFAVELDVFETLLAQRR